ncbi:regulator of G-protein signaling 7 [Clonorchis sinensis]|uniref:Regulator of G-protein signaling 7 n=1 Tax=Clonorchis sinensis TaxID=79923 RepID=G7Y5X7_CLOSI|nr:regulator of G-protein signaling 7 [Clonorchis sinensis]
MHTPIFNFNVGTANNPDIATSVIQLFDAAIKVVTVSLVDRRVRESRLIIWGALSRKITPTKQTQSLLGSVLTKPVPESIHADWLCQRGSKRTLGLLVTLSSPSAVQKILERADSIQRRTNLIVQKPGLKEMRAALVEIFRPSGKNFVRQRQEPRANRASAGRKDLANEKPSSKPPIDDAEKWLQRPKGPLHGTPAHGLTAVVHKSAWNQNVVASTRYRAGQQPSAQDLVITNERHFVEQSFAVLRMIRCTSSRIIRMDFQMLYGAYVRPLLEYANPVVYSGRTKDVILIERVQRAATKMVAGLKSMDYETRLAVLDLFPLEYRRLRGDLILTYALFEQGLANRFFTVDPANTRRGHGRRTTSSISPTGDIEEAKCTSMIRKRDSADIFIIGRSKVEARKGCILVCRKIQWYRLWSYDPRATCVLKREPMHTNIAKIYYLKKNIRGIRSPRPQRFHCLWVSWMFRTDVNKENKLFVKLRLLIGGVSSSSRNSPNDYIWQKVESLIEKMVSEENGIPVRNVKSLMSTIPSTFTGSDIVQWLMQHVGASDVAEAVNLGSRIASMGYIFCIDDHTLTVKNDNHTYYRFQTPFLYPSRCMEADTVDYAVYLCKRTMQNKQRLELTGFEAERLASLQNLYCHRWEFVYIQAEAEAKVDKKRDKLERLVLDSQERAYWDVHRPPPGCVNTTDIDMRKLCRAKRPKKIPCRPVNFPIPSGPDGRLLFSSLEGIPLQDAVAKLNAAFRTRIKTTKAAESLQNYCDQYSEFDLLLSASAITPSTATVGQPSATASATQLFAAGPNRAASPHNNTIAGRSASDKGIGGGRIGASGFVGFVSSGSTNFLRTVGSSNNTAGHSVAAGASLGGSGGGTTHGSLGHMIGASQNLSHETVHESASALNPWISDNPEYWNTEARPKYLPIRRVKRWSFSIHELLKDPIGLEEFQRWLEKEFSAENLRFWQACQELKGAPLRELRQRVLNIYNQYLAPNAVDPLNVDSRIADSIRRQLSNTSPDVNLDRYCFEEAESHIFHLMKSDSYYRFLRSDYYRELFSGVKKKSKKHRSGVGLAGGAIGVQAVGVGLD